MNMKRVVSKNTRTARLVAVALLAALPACLVAQNHAGGKRSWERERAGVLVVGRTDLLDTYLSQEKFTGTEYGYLAQTLARRDSSRWVRLIRHHVLMSVAGTRGNSRSLLTLMYNLQAGAMRRWQWTAPRLTLLAGAVIDGTIGGSYDTRNTNNPAQARLALSIDPTARLSWQCGSSPRTATLHYQVAVPLIGLAFSPNYGQSYYEIFSRGDYDHNVVCTSPFSAPQLYQQLYLDFSLWHTTFRVGYLGEIRQMKANNLKYHQYTHSITLGWRY